LKATKSKILENFAVSWLIAWGMSYIATAIFAPSIAGDFRVGILTYTLVGILIIATSTLKWFPNTNPFDRIRRFTLFVLASMSILSGVQSWTGVLIWNVPFASKELFQITMAFMDFISAVFMLILVPPED